MKSITLRSRLQPITMGLTTAIALLCCCLAVHSFSPAAGTVSSHHQTSSFPQSTSSRRRQRSTTAWLAMSSKDTETDQSFYPPLSEEEIRKLLDTVPVYAVRDSSDDNQDGLVLLKEKGNPNSIAYFFFSPQQANEVYAPLRAQQQEEASNGIGSSVNWDVTAFPFGLVWYSLLNNPTSTTEGETPWIRNGIEYRLAAIPKEMKAAKAVVRQSTPKSDNEATKLPDRFVPLFVNDSLRLQTTDGDPRGALFFSLDDLLSTYQKAIEADSETEASATVNITDLATIISQMQQQQSLGSTNFRQVMFIPPSQSSSTTEQQQPQMQVESPEDLDLPMATDLWSD